MEPFNGSVTGRLGLDFAMTAGQVKSGMERKSQESEGRIVREHHTDLLYLQNYFIIIIVIWQKASR